MTVRALAGWPLRHRLVALVLALVAAGLAVAGVAAAAALRGYLYAEVDRGLVDLAGRLAHTAPQVPGQLPDGGDRPVRPGPVGGEQLMYVEVLDATGRATVDPASVAAVTDPPVLPALTVAQAAALDGRAYVVDSESGGSRWRAVTLARPDGSGSVTVAADIAAIDATVQRLVALEVSIGLLVLVAVGLAAGVLVRRSLRPLVGVEHAAAAIAAGDLDRRAPTSDPRTEVGSLAASFNTMVDELQEAFAAQQASEAAARESAAAARASESRMRQFIADASHELRTPLTSVRGFAELYRIGAVPPGPRLDETMGRIEGEATRMGVLVEDLLLLARLDQQRPMDLAPVDLLALAGDAVEAARAAQPGRQLRLVPQGAGAAPIVRGDAVRLRQVVDNLLSNALRYSPEDQPVEVRVGVDGATGAGATGAGTTGAGPMACLEVADHGPGLSAEQAARVFERFYRADPARSRADGGNGLGLAIVAAITAAHGGVVEVDTAPDRGATFRVLLPLKQDGAPEGPDGAATGAGSPAGPTGPARE